MNPTLSATFNAGQSAEVVQISPDGRWGAVGTSNGAVGVFSLKEPGPPRWVAHHKKRVEVLAFDRGGTTLASAGDDGVINLVSLTTDQVRTLNGHRRKVWALAFSSDGRTLASGGDDKEIIVWDAPSGVEQYRLAREGARSLIYLGFNPMDTTLLGVDMSGVFSEWDVKTRARLRQLKEADTSIENAAGSFSGGLLAVNSEYSALQGAAGFGNSIRPGDLYREGRVKLYDTERFQVAKTIENVNGEVTSISLSADNNYIALGLFVRARMESSLAIYDVTHGNRIVSLPAKGNIMTVAFSADGQSLVSGADNGEVRVYSTKIRPGSELGEINGLKYKVTTSSPDALISAHANFTLGIMELDANGVDAGTAHVVADLLQTRIGANSSVTLVERTKIAQVIHEQNFQLSDRADPATAARLGQLIGARKMIFGSVSKLGASLIVHASMVNVENGKVDGSCEVICQKCAEEDLPEAISKLKHYLVADSH